MDTSRTFRKRVLFAVSVILTSLLKCIASENATLPLVKTSDNVEDDGNVDNPSNRLLLPAASSRLHYDGYKVVRAVPLTPLQLSALLQMTYEVDFDFWAQPRMVFTPVDIVVDPQAFPKLRKMLRDHWIVNWVTSNDIERNFFAGDLPSFGTRLGERFSFDQFHRLDDIYKRLDEYRASYPAEVTITVIGKSYEGREIKMVKLTDGKASETPKKVIFLDGGTHAREWITTSTVMYILDQLMSITGDSAIRSKFDWYIVPMVNPDGYEYTHITDRFWRKNRSPLFQGSNLFGRTDSEHTADETSEYNGPAGEAQEEISENLNRANGSHGGIHRASTSVSQNRQITWTQWLWNVVSTWGSSASVNANNAEDTRRNDANLNITRSTDTTTASPRSCVGVDLNRNWGHYWGKIGVDFNPCSFTFPGTKAFSELETQAMRDAFEAVHDRTLLYISYHSYGEMILLPWGYTYLVPDNFSDMKEKARLYAGKMRSWYKVGSGTWILYPAAGVTMDWMTQKGVPYVFTIELSPSRFQPVPGFAISASEIVKVGQENWDGLKALAVDLASTTT